MRDAIISGCVLIGIIYVIVRVPFIVPQWYLRRRTPWALTSRLKFVRRWAEKPAPVRLARARELRDRYAGPSHGLSEDENWARLEALVKKHEFAITGIIFSWLFLGLLACGAWLAYLSGSSKPVPWLVVAALWLMGGLAYVLGTYDWRRYQESEPTEHTVHLALYALDACHGRAPDYTGGDNPDEIARTVEAFCTALARRAEYTPDTRDPVLRSLARTDAELVIKNVQAAKIRLLRGDATALTELSQLLMSAIEHLVRAPTHPPDMKIANQDLLGPDPGWHGQVSQPTLTLRTGVSYVLFILYLVFVGVTANWAQLPATMAAILVPVLAAPALSVLRRYGLPIARPQPPNGDVMGQTSAQSTCNDP